MDVHEDLKNIQAAQDRAAAKRRLEKWEALLIAGLAIAAIGLLLFSRFL